jgi:quaternary ammonium compound-resistance protein SugE
LRAVHLHEHVPAVPGGQEYSGRHWVGIGALGTAIYGMAFLGEDRSVMRVLCFMLILAGIVGLKLISVEKA